MFFVVLVVIACTATNQQRYSLSTPISQLQ
jgi:hypothetical protein